MIEQLYRKMLWAAVYPLLLGVMAGATWVDRLYVQSLRAAVPPGAFAAAGQRVSDGLLLLSVLVVASGVLSASLHSGMARGLVAASLGIFSLEFLLPVVATWMPGGAIYLATLGPALRMGILVVALGLAVYATRRALA